MTDTAMAAALKKAGSAQAVTMAPTGELHSSPDPAALSIDGELEPKGDKRYGKRQKPPRKATFAEAIAVNNILTNKCAKTTDGFCEYNEGYNDTRVAAEASGEGRQISPSTVASVRTQMYGNLRQVQPTPANARDELREAINILAERLDAADARIRVLEGWGLK